MLLCRDERLDREVAVKRLHADSPAETEQDFLREAKLGASLNHPNLVSVFDTAIDDEGVLIVMEYVEGEALSRALKRGPLDHKRVAAMARDLGDALDHAHEQGVVHRDVKPANVLLRRDGVTKLVDLGIATASDQTLITGSGMVLGTASYMSPRSPKAARPGPPPTSTRWAWCSSRRCRVSARARAPRRSRSRTRSRRARRPTCARPCRARRGTWPRSCVARWRATRLSARPRPGSLGRRRGPGSKLASRAPRRRSAWVHRNAARRRPPPRRERAGRAGRPRPAAIAILALLFLALAVATIVGAALSGDDGGGGGDGAAQEQSQADKPSSRTTSASRRPRSRPSRPRPRPMKRRRRPRRTRRPSTRPAAPSSTRRALR